MVDTFIRWLGLPFALSNANIGIVSLYRYGDTEHRIRNNWL